eukprot:3566536-Alexandrium_andersonii.AAC.1
MCVVLLQVALLFCACSAWHAQAVVARWMFVLARGCVALAGAQRSMLHAGLQWTWLHAARTPYLDAPAPAPQFRAK